jgi:uncharacterized protein YehS (DUF1456 family)
MHTYTKQERLSDIDTNDIGEHIEDFGDETLNKAFGKFCIMDDEMSFHKVLTDEMGYDDDEVDSSHVDIVQKTVEETLKQVNLVFKNLGIALEFKQADMVEYGAYMLTGKGDTEEDMGVRIRRLVDGKTV